MMDEGEMKGQESEKQKAESRKQKDKNKDSRLHVNLRFTHRD
jgi:hypothetical protein